MAQADGKCVGSGEEHGRGKEEAVVEPGECLAEVADGAEEMGDAARLGGDDSAGEHAFIRVPPPGCESDGEERSGKHPGPEKWPLWTHFRVLRCRWTKSAGGEDIERKGLESQDRHPSEDKSLNERKGEPRVGVEDGSREGRFARLSGEPPKDWSEERLNAIGYEDGRWP